MAERCVILDIACMKEGDVVRVAQILGKMEGGGVEQTVLNYYNAIDRDEVQFDFFVFEGSSMIPFEEIEKRGGTVTQLPRFSRPFSYVRVLRAALKNGGYSIAHCHLSTLSFLPLFAARLAGVNVRIIHNHSTSGGKRERLRNFAKTLLKPIAPMFATHRVACSELAAHWMYGKRSSIAALGELKPKSVTIMRNSVDIDKFSFSAEKRRDIRSEFGISEDTVLYGHIGRFCPQKNQSFLLDIFAEITKLQPNSILLLAGKGEDLSEIKQKSERLGLSDRVIFAGHRSDADKLYCAFDCFIMPSNYEGLPVVGVEAQCSGVGCLFSDKVTKEVLFTDGAEMLPLSLSAQGWAAAAIEKSRSRYPRAAQQVSDSGFDIGVAAKALEKFYKRLV